MPMKLAAVHEFLRLPESTALAAANKRIGNILKKSEGQIGAPNAVLLREDAEKALFAEVQRLTPQVQAHVAAEAYPKALHELATVRTAVDTFFDKVMVNVDDPALRANRLGLLKSLYEQLNAVADISKIVRSEA